MGQTGNGLDNESFSIQRFIVLLISETALRDIFKVTYR